MTILKNGTFYAFQNAIIPIEVRPGRKERGVGALAKFRMSAYRDIT